MTRVRYRPPEVGGAFDLRVSSELARLFLGFLGTISERDLRGLPSADVVRDEISELHSRLDQTYNGNPGPWRDRGRELRFEKT